MTLIGWLDTAAVVILLAAAWRAGAITAARPEDTHGWLFTAALGLFCLVAAGNALEHLGITSIFDGVEDYVEILLAPLLLFALYTRQLNHAAARLRTASEELARGEAKYRLLVENTSFGVLLCVLPAGRITYANPKAAEMLGFDRTVDRETEIWQILEAESGAQLRAYVERTADRGRPVEALACDLTLTRRDGSRLQAAANGTVTRNGALAMLQLVLLDITDRGNIERQLQHARKMEAIGTLAGGVAHDFNNILAVIMGYAELGLMDAAPDSPMAGALNHIMGAARRARDLVAQILTFSRKKESELSPIQLNEPISTAVALLERTLPKMIRLELHLAPDLALVRGDAAQLEQTVINLAGNAQDAMPEGGTITIRTANAAITADDPPPAAEMPPGAYVRMSFSDDGVGMDETVLQQVFDPFFTTKEVGKGTGLGLSTVYGIVKAHQGYIACRSQPGRGTTFDLFIPAYGDEPLEFDLDTDEMRGAPGTVLLVDDEDEIRAIGRTVLAAHGYSVLTADSGEQALEIYRRQPDEIDLIVLDLGMPGMGGRRCLTELLAINPRATVLVASGYSQDSTVQEVLRLGAAGFVGKPFVQEELLSAMRTLRTHS